MTHRMILATSLAIACAASPSWAADTSPTDDFMSSWLAMVGRSQDEQPHWMTPLATVTPRLEQEFRFDVFSETLPTHAHLDNYGAGKGLEIIPTENTEIIIGAPPPYETRRSNVGKTLADGWADWPALLVKYRFLSANEQQGNYIVTGFLQLSAPTGNTTFTNHFYIIQPTIAFGNGWDDFDVQATISEQFSTGGVSTNEKNFGRPLLVNIAAQYHLFDVLWPELEVNSTWCPDGTKEGKTQLFLTLCPPIAGTSFGRVAVLHECDAGRCSGRIANLGGVGSGLRLCTDRGRNNSETCQPDAHHQRPFLVRGSFDFASGKN
jgi:hypothetical protein